MPTALESSTDPERSGTGFMAFGLVRIDGAVKSPTFNRLTREPTAGRTALTATRTLAGWAAGDRLVIPDSRHLKWDEAGSRFSLQCEDLTLGTASGAQLNLTSVLRFNHPGARNGDGVLEFLPHVGNLTRNVIIRSQSPTGTRGHVISADGQTSMCDTPCSRTSAGPPWRRSTARRCDWAGIRADRHQSDWTVFVAPPPPDGALGRAVERISVRC